MAIWRAIANFLYGSLPWTSTTTSGFFAGGFGRFTLSSIFFATGFFASLLFPVEHFFAFSA